MTLQIRHPSAGRLLAVVAIGHKTDAGIALAARCFVAASVEGYDPDQHFHLNPALLSVPTGEGPQDLIRLLGAVDEYKRINGHYKVDRAWVPHTEVGYMEFSL